MTRKTIKLLVADDQLIAREGWKRILESESRIQVVGEASRAIEAIQKARELQPDLMLVDLKWFGDETAGWSAIGEIKNQTPKIKIIAVTAYENLIRDARRAGADGALLKTFTREELVKTIFDLFPSGLPSEENSLKETLSPREIEILKLIVKKYSDQEIANQMTINVVSVKNHVKSILQKLDADNRIEASKIAIDTGLVKTDK